MSKGHPIVKCRIDQAFLDVLEAHLDVFTPGRKSQETVSQFIRRAMKRQLVEDLRHRRNRGKKRSSRQSRPAEEDEGITPQALAENRREVPDEDMEDE